MRTSSKTQAMSKVLALACGVGLLPTASRPALPAPRGGVLSSRGVLTIAPPRAGGWCELRFEGELTTVRWAGTELRVRAADLREVRALAPLRVTGALEASHGLRIEAPRLAVAGHLAGPQIELAAFGWLEVEPRGRVEVGAGGQLELQADVLALAGRLGAPGGEVRLRARNVLAAGAVDVDAPAGKGGTIEVRCERYLGTAFSLLSACASAGEGGSISVQASRGFFSSGRHLARGRSGGRIHVAGSNTALVAATLDASGAEGGGSVRVGTRRPDEPPLARPGQRWAAATLLTTEHTLVRAVGDAGPGGTIVVGSAQSAALAGVFAAGSRSDVGGRVELSSAGRLEQRAAVSTWGPRGGGAVLLDPQDLILDASASSIPHLDLVDPNADGSRWGDNLTALSNGNVVVTDPDDDFGATDAGAAYLYSGATGALLSTLLGSQAGDQVADLSAVEVGSGNFVVPSTRCDNGGVDQAGAVTWGSGTVGVSGSVSASNSLVGSTDQDRIGSSIVRVAQGNYVMVSANWDNGAAVDAGCAVWCDGSTGRSGSISAANAVVGAQSNDSVRLGCRVLSNGNYLVTVPGWDDGAAADVGAVVWGDGTTGVTGVVSAAIALVGATAGDEVGTDTNDLPICALPNGNYVVPAPRWDNGALADAGAATWCNGTTGRVGPVSAANSLVGTSANDRVGNKGVTALTQGNYVVSSSLWSGGVGAATWGDGSAGVVGPVGAGNSLIGAVAGDEVGHADSGRVSVLALTNGNYVVCSPRWDDGATANVGAVTWGDGTSGATGVVSATNSLVGSTANDQVGGNTSGGPNVLALTNGHYAVLCPSWTNGASSSAGAVTWGNGSGGTTGAVSAANSLVGSTAFSLTGARGARLANGNYVVSSLGFNNGGVAFAGAVTLCGGTGGTIGLVSAANSLVGSSANDFVGLELYALAGGNYVTVSSFWDNGGSADAGAATWGDGTTGVTGVVTASNSLVGSTTGDFNSKVFAVLTNGNYVLITPEWDNGGSTNAGAVTWGDGARGVKGQISAATSLVGTQPNDQVGSGVALENPRLLHSGDFGIVNSFWDNGPLTDEPAWVLVDGARGVRGTISADNTLIGTGSAVSLAGRPLSGRRGMIVSNEGTRVSLLWFLEDTTFAQATGSTVSSTLARLVELLSEGTDVTLQASRDLVLNSPLVVDNPAGEGGALTLIAGRSVRLLADVSTDGGDLTVIANAALADGVIDADRSAGAARVEQGGAIDAGLGSVRFETKDGAGLTNRTRADYALAAVTASDWTVVPFGSLAPSAPSQGESVTITGGGLENASVTVGGVAAVLTGSLSGSLTLQLGSGTPAGSQPVVVTTPRGSATLGTLTVTPTAAPTVTPSGGGGAGRPRTRVVTTTQGGCSLGPGGRPAAPEPVVTLLLLLVAMIVVRRPRSPPSTRSAGTTEAPATPEDSNPKPLPPEGSGSRVNEVRDVQTVVASPPSKVTRATPLPPNRVQPNAIAPPWPIASRADTSCSGLPPVTTKSASFACSRASATSRLAVLSTIARRGRNDPRLLPQHAWRLLLSSLAQPWRVRRRW